MLVALVDRVCLQLGQSKQLEHLQRKYGNFLMEFIHFSTIFGIHNSYTSLFAFVEVAEVCA